MHTAARRSITIAALALAPAWPAGARTVTAQDLARLQQAADQLAADLPDLRDVDPVTPGAHDAVVPPSGQSSAPREAPPPQPVPAGQAVGELPAGQQLDVRLLAPLSSETAQVEDRFEGVTLVDLYRDGQLLVPAGSPMRGVVGAVQKAGRVDRKGSLTLTFDQITVRGQAYPVRATVVQALESKGIKGEVGKIATGAALGGIVGGVLGGTQGLILGIVIGAGGSLVATPGKNVELEQGTVIRARFDTPVTLNR